ncbi:PIN domain-containing protein [Paenibacillus antibioticophila]|uniref:PIN domain-containing protein n=1 Tax=Paenibacillus antibioticophila TaxID=1274374 RepID=UPI0005CB26C5|nr:PIN domain-containing protein [Paenibacillus antibioticophila]
MFKILIDTCVWLDLAKDYQQQALLAALEELVQQGEIELVLPRTIIDEFARNKDRVIEQSSRSISSTLKRVKEVVEKFGDPQQKSVVISQLNDVDHRLPILGEAAVDMVSRIERLFSSTPAIEISDAVKLRAAQRAIDKRAPFHRQRNGIDDAILIEIYADLIGESEVAGNQFAFISHNTHDFSHPNANKKLPHPDIGACFSTTRSLYFISLSEALQYIQPEQFEDLMIEHNWVEEPRRLTEIVEAIDEFSTKVWYNRHQVRREKIEAGLVEIVEKEHFPIKNHETRPIQRDIWEGALKSAARVEERFGLDDLGPWDDFEWGMINGKLSALRWVLGDKWDMLDT